MDQHLEPNETQPFDGSSDGHPVPAYSDVPEARNYERQPEAYRDDPEGVHDFPPPPPRHSSVDITSPHKSDSCLEACLMFSIRRKKLMAVITVVTVSLLITYIVLMTKGGKSGTAEVGDPHGHIEKDSNGNYIDPSDDPQKNPAAFEPRIPPPPAATNWTHHIQNKNAFQHFCNRTLDANSKYYLTQDVVCNTNYGPILSNNTYLDCQGYSITAGPNSKLKKIGITVPSGASSATIMNCGVSNWDIGMKLDGAGSFVQNSEAFDNREDGIVTSGNNNLIQCTIARNNTGNGIYTISGGLLTIAGCLLEGNWYGITMFSGVDVVCSLMRNNSIAGVTIPLFAKAENRMSDDVLIENGQYNFRFDSIDGTLRLNRIKACNAGADLGKVDNGFSIVKNEVTCDTITGDGAGNVTCDSPCPPLESPDPSSVALDWETMTSAMWALDPEKCQATCEKLGRFTPPEISQ